MFGGRDSGRESNSSSTANGSTSSGRRESTRESRSKTSFFKKLLLPGPWKPRSQGWEEQLQSLPDGMREQVLEQVQGQHAKGKKLRILFDDGENIGSEDIMRATYSGPRVRADPTTLHFFKYGELTYKQALVHGFYAPFGDFPEVAEKDELPQLSELMERCSVLEGREVILIDTQVDSELRAFLDGPVVEAASAAGDVLMVRVQRVAGLVASRLGGAMTDGALGAQYSTYSQSLQYKQGSTVLLLGSLSVGTSCHRALLAKLALLRVGITSAIRPTGNSRIDGVAPPKCLFWQHEGSVEYVVNLTDRPGDLTPQGTVSSKPHAALTAAQATPPQAGQASLPTSASHAHLHATPPGSPQATPASSQTALPPAVQPLQPPAAVYDALANLHGDPARHSSASTHPALSRGGSAASLITDATGGGRGPVIGGATMPTDLGTQLDATDTSGTAEPAHSSLSGRRGIRGSDSPRGGGSLPLDIFQRGGSMTPPRSLSPTPTTFINRLPNPFAPGMADTASAAALVSAGSGLSTQVSMNNAAQPGSSHPALGESQSMPSPSGSAQVPGGNVTGATAATSAAVVAAALGGPPRLVAWPFGNPEILSVAVRMQSRSGHSGSRRRGASGNSAGALSSSAVDDAHNHHTSERHARHRERDRERERERDRERAHNEAVLWMSTESSIGAGGGLNGSFLGGDSGGVASMAGGAHGANMRHTTHTTHASQLATGLGRHTGGGPTSQSTHSLLNLPDADAGAPSAAQSLQDLSPPSLQHTAAHSSPTLFGDYGAAMGALSGGGDGGGPVGSSASVPTLPQSISASSATPATASSNGGSSRRRHRHRLKSAFEGSGELRAGAAEAFQNIPHARVSPSRPPVRPSARSALSANTASPPHGSPTLDAPLEAWPSSNGAPRLSELDLRPDTTAGPSAVISEETAAWWHGSSRFEVLTQASDPSRYSGSDVHGHGGGRTPGGGDSSIAASSGMDGAGFSGPGLGALASGPPASGSMSATPSSRHATFKGGAFGDAGGHGNGSDTDLDEAASGTVQKFPPIPEAPERWGIGVMSTLPTGFGDDSDGLDDTGAGSTFRNPTGHWRFNMRNSGGSANLDTSSAAATPAATSTPTRTHSPLSAAAPDKPQKRRKEKRSSSSSTAPAAGFASIFRGAFDDDDEEEEDGEGEQPQGGAGSGSGSRSPPVTGMPRAQRHSSGSYRSAPPATPEDDGTLASDSPHSDSSLSRGGRSGVARPYAGRLLSPFGEEDDDGEETEEDNLGGEARAPEDPRGSRPNGLGMLQPLPGAFGGGVGIAPNLLSSFAEDTGTSGEVSIHSNRIPPVGGAGSSSLTPPRTPTPASNATGTTPHHHGSRNGNSHRSDGTAASTSNSRGATPMHAFSALPKGTQNPNGLPSDSYYDPSSPAADSSAPGTQVDHSVNLDNVPELTERGMPLVDMSGAISLDHNSTALPSAEAHLRALMQNTSIHTLEAQFRMWINTSDITMTETVIGRGSYGQVMLAKFRTERCAVKQIVCETKAEYRAAMQEMLLMQELQFDKIVRFFGAIKRGRGVLWMCMEYMPFSDLRKILHNSEHRRTVRFAESMLSLPRRLKWAKDVVAALDLLHSRAVVHRDLKPGNVLISNKGDAVLSDFGLSRVREAQQSRLQASGPGTVSYAAPEALQANQVSPASDMFSFGCVLWELLSMKEPWAELHGATFQIMSRICHEKASLRVEDIAQDVREAVPNVIAELRKCLSFDPEQRPSAEHVYDVLDDAIESL